LAARSIGAVEWQQVGVVAPTTRAEFELAPNPCGNSVTLFCKGKEALSEISVRDVLGREVHRVIIPYQRDAGSIPIDVADLIDGTYTLLIRISEGGLIRRGSFVKMR
jgi:hypothetical protein